jgi:hypothetical protein
MSFKAKAKSSEGDFELPPGGTYPAVWIGLINLGTQPREYNGKKWEEEKILFIWELTSEADANGENFTVQQDYTFSLHEKANLRKMLEAFWGKSMGEDQELDLVILIGKPCVLSLTEGKSSKGQKFIEIASVARPMKGQNVPAPTREPFVWDFDLHDGNGDPPIPDWVHPLYGRDIVEEIKRSPEWTELLRREVIPASKPANGQGKPAAVAADSDVPY